MSPSKKPLAGKLAWVIAAGIAPPAYPASGPFFNLDVFAYSEAVSIDTLKNDWKGPYSGGETALAFGRLELGGQMGNWQLSTQTRYDYTLQFSRDTADIFHQSTNKESLTPGRQYALKIIARHSFSDGVRLGHDFNFLNDTLSLNIGGSYLKGRKLTEGDIRGQAMATAASDYDFSFNVDSYYSEDKLFDRPVNAPSGDGYSFDLKLDWQITDTLASTLTLDNVLGRIYWKDTPHTEAIASSDIKTFDADGYVQYQPVLSGREDNKDFTQRLDTLGSAQLDYRWRDKQTLLLRVDHYGIMNFVGIGMTHHGDLQWQGVYYPTTSALMVRTGSEHWHIGLTLDNLDTDKAHTIALNTGLFWPF